MSEANIKELWGTIQKWSSREATMKEKLTTSEGESEDTHTHTHIHTNDAKAKREWSKVE